MRYLTLGEVVQLHRRILAQTGGADGVRSFGGLQSALAQPEMTFGGQELYPTIESKAAAICLSLVVNHPFVDGNKRVGHAVMETFLVLNGYELSAEVDDAERIMLRLAAGELTREDLLAWVTAHVQRRS
ncbi:MAG: type II toxin-antitoxin system death-on-curing family toxin [Thermoguttaceae bacterium]|jgi:death-on-curing protein|nr:type II toxin-antitoxin system death-on-curing family toxin [Thermoguttaceae bacterium]